MACAIVDGRISHECELALEKRGYTVIKTAKNSHISEAVSYHPDMLLFKHENKIITSVYYAEEAECFFSDLRYYAPKLSIYFADERQGAKYPTDAIYNCLVIGNKMFCKTDTISNAVIEHARKCGLDIIHVNQGYPACTVLPLSDKSAITADIGMCKALTECKIKVTLIENGDISLPPHEYGFIGGCAGIDGGRVYFLGDITRHRSYDKIAKACFDEGLEIVSLGTDIPADLGRIFFI